MTDRNANRPGYKRTPAGWIPEEWGCCPLGRVARLLSGGTPSMEKREYWDGNVPWYSAKDLKTFRLGASVNQVTEAGIRNGTREIPANTVLVLVRGMMLNRAFPIGITTSRSCFNQDLKAVVSGQDQDPLYLAYLLVMQETRFLSQVDRSSHGTGKLQTALLETAVFAFPPLPEQKKIADVLSTWDEAIEQTRAFTTAAKRRKKALMQQLLTGKKRLPGFGGATKCLRTPLGELPENWPSKPLSDVFSPVKRRNTKGVKLVLTASGQNGLVDQRSYFTKTIAGVVQTGYYLLKRGEFAYNRSAMDGYPYGAIKRLELHEEGILSTLYSCFRLNDPNCDSSFYTQFFETRTLDRQLRSIAHVGGRAHGLLNVTDSDFYAILVPVPPLPEQRAIAAVLTTADEEIKYLEAKCAALERQKKGLMQKLLTGEVRVKAQQAVQHVSKQGKAL